MYDRVNWINEQEGTTTPLNAENLNTMDEGIANLDERVTEIEENPPLADAFKTIKIGLDEIIASGADSIELVAGSNVNITTDTENKRIVISATGGGGGGGHDMIQTVEGVEAITSPTDEHVVSAYVVKNYSNRHTDSVIVTLAADNNQVSIIDDILKNDDATYEFMFEPTANADGEFENLVLSKYTLDTTAGAMTITVENAPTVNTRIRVDVTTYRA